MTKLDTKQTSSFYHKAQQHDISAFIKLEVPRKLSKREIQTLAHNALSRIKPKK